MDLLDELLEHLSISVKKDHLTKKSLLLTAISAYSNNPLNLFLKGESGVGKSYNAVQALKYFPRKDVWLLGALSPTALAHDYGVLEDENNDEIVSYVDDEGKNAYRYKESMDDITKERFKEIMRNAHYAIDLRWKILLFLESPSYETYARMRPILSHDDWEITYKFTDKTSKGSFSVRTALLRGWPATIFCTTDSKWMQDMVTRSINISPDESQEKYKEAGKVIASKYMAWRKTDPKLAELQNKVKIVISELKSNSPPHVFIPFADKLTESFPLEAGGDMRALDHYLSLIQNSSLLNMYDRPVLRKIDGVTPSDWPTAILSTFQDYRLFHEIFLEFAEASRAGIPRKALSLFKSVINGKGVLSVEDMAKEAKKLGVNRTARQISNYELRHLRDSGFIREVSDSDDKRKKNWEAVGESDPVYNPQLSLSTGFLCPFSRFDAQTFLNKILYDLGIPHIEDFVKSGGLVMSMEDIRHQHGKLLLSFGLNSTLLSNDDFVQYLVFPDSNSDQQNKPEDTVLSEKTGLYTNLDNHTATDEDKSGKPEYSKMITWRCPGCRAGPFTESAKVVKDHQKDCIEYKEYCREHPNDV